MKIEEKITASKKVIAQMDSNKSAYNIQKKALFGALKEQIVIKEDITSPIDLEWNAMQ